MTRPLSPAQTAIARLLALGYSNHEIAAQRGCSVKTIDTHRAAILHRLGVRNNVALARLAVREHWVPLDAAVEPVVLNHHVEGG